MYWNPQGAGEVERMEGMNKTGPLTVHSEPLAITHALIAAEEVLEVVVFILDRADLIIFVDEIAVAWRVLLELVSMIATRNRVGARC